MAQRTSIAEMWSGSVRHARKVPVRFDLVVESLTPAWNAGGEAGAEAMHEQPWASHHYQQTVHIGGRIVVDGVSSEVSCTGVRDHSRGPRDMSTWHGHCLLTAAFPGGRAVGMFAVFGADGAPVLSAAYVARDGVISRGTVRQLPPGLSERVLERESFVIELDVEGRVHRIDVETARRDRQRSFLTMLAPNDLVLGFDRADPGAIGLSWVPARYIWDGDEGYGPVERSVLGGSLTSGEPTTI
jgi:hypothetical protein